MANQSPDRREILELLAKAAVIGQFAGFSRWACAAEFLDHERSSPRPAAYQPQFFAPAEYRLVDQLAEMIIPKDESPGARDAGVVEFIDFMVAHDDSLQYPFRTGLAWLNAFATESYGSNFLKLSADQQESLLRRLAYKAQQLPAEIQGQEFFGLMRKYTIFGYYTSKIGLEELDYPGLRLYASSPECPHHDDPEHKHLSAPRF